MISERLLKIDEDKLELTEISDGYERQLRIQYGNIVEVEPPQGDWYCVVPVPAIVDTFARFFQRLIWQRDGMTPVDLPRDEETELTKEGLIGEEAKALAENYLGKVCRKIDASLEFFLQAEWRLTNYVECCFKKEFLHGESTGLPAAPAKS